MRAATIDNERLVGALPSGRAQPTLYIQPLTARLVRQPGIEWIEIVVTLRSCVAKESRFLVIHANGGFL